MEILDFRPANESVDGSNFILFPSFNNIGISDFVKKADSLTILSVKFIRARRCALLI